MGLFLFYFYLIYTLKIIYFIFNMFEIIHDKNDKFYILKFLIMFY